jgi:GH15 family glucan-1,4-alpha-glucosidase
MRLEELGLIGNCQYSALISRAGDVAWCCLPQFDSAPVFSTLLDEIAGGCFSVTTANGAPGVQRYLDNTNVLETTFRTHDGAFRLIDFAPRFVQHDRLYRPTRLCRVVEPIDGTPWVRVRCEPRLGWSAHKAPFVQGSSHLQFEGFESPLRLTTDIPLSYVNGQPFALTERRHLVLAYGAPVEEPLAPLCENFLRATVSYWQRWVKHCNVPPAYQRAVIRSALALKLHCFEDTGAIVAAMTTSIPEAPESGRTWDYRYCWLRDAYYALEAFRLLGHFEERECFIIFLLNVAGHDEARRLAPLYRVNGSTDLDERIEPEWPGYNRDGPVRVGNAAVHQTQHDIYGEMVLALAPIYFDDRFSAERTNATLDLLTRLTRKAIDVAGTPDSGIWEPRTAPRPQTYSTLMSWAAADRMATIADRHLPGLTNGFRHHAERLRNEILDQAWHPVRQTFTAAYRSEDLDASLLEMASLRFLPPDDARLLATVEAIGKGLSQNGWLLRYRTDDGFGPPRVAFLLCSFWMVEALAVVGRPSAARELMDKISRLSTPLGLLSEDCDTDTMQLHGNFPQAYSHVGLIHAAFATSPRWSDIL